MSFAADGQMPSGTGLEGLVAKGPNSDHADKLMLFGQFVGDWEVDFTVYLSDVTKQIAKAEWHFAWVLEGRAIQDVFIIPRRSDHASDWSRKDYGTCLRFYDPVIDAWRVVWVSPSHSEVLNFTATQVADEIVLEGKDQDETPMRWIFSKITTNSFQWRRVFSTDDGTTWQLHKEMTVSRNSLK